MNRPRTGAESAGAGSPRIAGSPARQADSATTAAICRAKRTSADGANGASYVRRRPLAAVLMALAQARPQGAVDARAIRRTGWLPGAAWARYLGLDARQELHRAHGRATASSSSRGFIVWCLERGLTRPADVTKPILERYQRSSTTTARTTGSRSPFAARHGAVAGAGLLQVARASRTTSSRTRRRSSSCRGWRSGCRGTC